MNTKVGIGHVLAEGHDPETCGHCRFTIARSELELIAELMAGLQVPRSLGGVLGEAIEPYDKLRDRWGLFGWQTPDDIFEAISGKVGKPRA